LPTPSSLHDALPICTRDLLAVPAQVVEAPVARLLEILQAAVDERRERIAWDAVARARVVQRDRHRTRRGGVERRAQRLQPFPLRSEEHTSELQSPDH